MARPDKQAWQGQLMSVQPRIRLLRSFDQRSHSYLGYVLSVEGMIGNEEREFLVGIGKGAQQSMRFVPVMLCQRKNPTQKYITWLQKD
jgi:hypothetical protein